MKPIYQVEKYGNNPIENPHCSINVEKIKAEVKETSQKIFFVENS